MLFGQRTNVIAYDMADKTEAERFFEWPCHGISALCVRDAATNPRTLEETRQ
jgi:hypothetical protein